MIARYAIPLTEVYGAEPPSGGECEPKSFRARLIFDDNALLPLDYMKPGEDWLILASTQLSQAPVERYAGSGDWVTFSEPLKAEEIRSALRIKVAG